MAGRSSFDALPFVGDTLSFVNDPVRFVNAKRTGHGPIFVSKLLAAPTAFACSYDGVRQLLEEVDGNVCTGSAYGEFLSALYPSPNVLLLESGDERRAQLLSLSRDALNEDAAAALRPVVWRMCRPLLDELHRTKQLKLYAAFKPLCERISLALVLGESFAEDNITSIRGLCAKHFSGIVAMPVAIGVFGRKTARKKALDARGELRAIVAARAAELRAGVRDEPCLLRTLVQSGIDEDLAHEHALLLLSAAIPKCLASALCSLFVEFSTAKDEKKESLPRDQHLRAALMEVLRLHPPMLGGMRVIEGDGASVCDIHVPKGHRVWWSAHHANRDPAVYNDADSFSPDRWNESVRAAGCPFAQPESQNAPPLPLSFGAGDRLCAGRMVAWTIMYEIANAMGEHFEVQGGIKNRPKMRYVPVCRPVDDVVMLFRERGDIGSDGSNAAHNNNE